METPPGFNLDFICVATIGDLPLLKKFAAKFENGEGPGKVSYANLKTSFGHNALHMAAAAGKKHICRYLIEKMNFDINDIDNEGETPLFAAIQERHQPTIHFLVNNGADVTKSDNHGATPLHFSAAEGSPEIMKLLISKGADIHATSRLGMPLHYAAKEGNIDTLKLLLDLKADPNCISPNYVSPLVMSILVGRSIECMELLLKGGADPNLQYSDSQNAPLCCAVIIEDKEMTRCLLNAGADPNWTDLSCKTALECAALSDCREMVELLFPVTSRIALYPDWSVNGVMQHIRSKEVKEQMKSKMKEKARVAPFDAEVLSNRSLCWTLLNDGKPALEDAQTCVRLVPGWAEGHYREGAALKVLKRYHEAAEAYSRALALDPDNQEIENAYREVLAEGAKGSH